MKAARVFETGRQNVPAGNMWTLADRQAVMSGIIRIADVGLIALAGIVSFKLQQGELPRAEVNWLAIILAALFAMEYFQYAGLYRSAAYSRPGAGIPKLILVWGCVAATVLVLNHPLKLSASAPRNWLIGFLLLSVVVLIAVRLVIHHWLAMRRRAGAFAIVVAVVGFADPARRLVDRLVTRLGNEIQLAGIFALDRPEELDDLVSLCRVNRIDEVLVALPLNGNTPLEIMLRPLRDLPINVELAPEMPEGGFSCLSFTELYGVPTVSIMKQPLTGLQVAMKRAADIVISALILIAALPVMILVAILIKLDSPGPILFRQARWGFNSNIIQVLKFRSMRIEAAGDATAPQAQRNDPRVTRIGRLLRRTSLDELPQLLNVLRGDMSLVGPRPHAVSHNEYYAARIDNYLGRHRLKPGITGLAQVNGARGITDTLDKMERRVNFDLMYIDNWSLGLDLKILARTLLVAFHPNAF